MTRHARTGFAGTVLESARQTFVRLRVGRSWWFLAAIAATFAAGAAFARTAADELQGEAMLCVVAWWMLGTVLMPWGTLFLAVQALHGSLEDRTFQYLFVRPVGRVPLLLGTTLAVAVAGALQVAVAVVVLFLGIATNPEVWPGGVDARAAWVCAGVFAAGAGAYAAVGALFASAFRRPLVWAAFFVVGLQQLTANLPVSAGLRRLTITDPMRRALLDRLEPDGRLAEMMWPAEDFRLELVGEPLRDLAVLTVVALALAAWAYGRSEYDSRLRE
jgi:hypothetical protein